MRITDKDLNVAVMRLNGLTKSPVFQYANGRANVGNFHIHHAYGGVALHRMVNTSGGATDVLSSGHVPKRELYGLLHAFIAGIEFH